MKVEKLNCPKCYSVMQIDTGLGMYICPKCGTIRDKELNWNED